MLSTLWPVPNVLLGIVESGRADGLDTPLHTPIAFLVESRVVSFCRNEPWIPWGTLLIRKARSCQVESVVDAYVVERETGWIFFERP